MADLSNCITKRKTVTPTSDSGELLSLEFLEQPEDSSPEEFPPPLPKHCLSFTNLGGDLVDLLVSPKRD